MNLLPRYLYPAWPSCAQAGGSCVVQYDYMRDWLWCIRCRHPKLTAEQLERLGTRI